MEHDALTQADLLHAMLLATAQEHVPRRYRWACVACRKAGTATDPLAPCPFCGGPSMLASLSC